MEFLQIILVVILVAIAVIYLIRKFKKKTDGKDCGEDDCGCG